MQKKKKKKQIQQKRKGKLAKAEMSQHNFKGTSRYYVVTKKKLTSRLEAKIVAAFTTLSQHNKRRT